jgi:hypothetical protein
MKLILESYFSQTACSESLSKVRNCEGLHCPSLALTKGDTMTSMIDSHSGNVEFEFELDASTAKK